MATRRPPPADDDGGMIDLDTFERDEAVREEARQAAAADAPQDELLPGVTAERLRALKDQARQQIDERLKARRKQRRLMRGGDLPK